MAYYVLIFLVFLMALFIFQAVLVRRRLKVWLSVASRYEEEDLRIFIESQFKRDFNIEFPIVFYSCFYKVCDEVELYKVGFPNAQRVDSGFVIYCESVGSREKNIVRDAVLLLADSVLNKVIPVSEVCCYASQKGILIVYKGMLS